MFAQDLAGVSVDSTESKDSYTLSPVHFSREMDVASHAPFTSAAMAVLAPAIARFVFRSQCVGRKMVVLDCDNTLWGGAVGEVGPGEVRLDEHFLALQRFFVGLQREGWLLCLCSRNIEDDVLAVFRERCSEMELTLEHVIGVKANWVAKSENIKALVEELSLGLDSVVFVDDNPVECAEVEANCPGVVSVLLPPPVYFEAFVRNLWVFDSPLKNETRTEEDGKRTELYRGTLARNKTRSAFATFSSFMASLNLWMDFAPMDEDNIERIAQLTDRTNQHNACKRPLTIEALEAMRTQGTHEVFAVTTGDRFCTHGLVGIFIVESGSKHVHLQPSHPSSSSMPSDNASGDLDDRPLLLGGARMCNASVGIGPAVLLSPTGHPIFAQAAEASVEQASDLSCLRVSTFLLSCRTLHLGIEHAMVITRAHEATLHYAKLCDAVQLIRNVFLLLDAVHW
jgi:FkbH-like protein